MTDNEIIKALECCSVVRSICCQTDKCPYSQFEHCESKINEDALALIQRQKAEIEDAQNRLELWVKKFFEKKEEAELISTDVYKAVLEKVVVRRITAEAIKEFADKLKANRPRLKGGQQVFYIRPEEVDNLVKEMVGADE